MHHKLITIMEQRNTMNFFLEDSHGEENGTVSGFYVENQDNIYAGRELYYDNNKITYYFLPTDSDEALMFLYIGDDTFDEFVNNVDEYNLDGVNNAWPLLVKALRNGINDNYTDSALIKLPDLTHSNNYFWCLATKVENVDFEDLETSYVLKKMVKLYSDAMQMFGQINENDISTWDAFRGGARAGLDNYRRGSNAIRIAKTALMIGGALCGIDLSGFSGED